MVMYVFMLDPAFNLAEAKQSASEPAMYIIEPDLARGQMESKKAKNRPKTQKGKLTKSKKVKIRLNKRRRN